MKEVFRYRSRVLSSEDVAGVRRLIAQNPQASRRALSRLVCEAWDWRQSNGAWCDMVCRSLMLALHRAGQIELPAKRRSPRNYLAERRKPATDFLLDQSPVQGPLAALRPLSIRQVRRTGEEALFNGLMERYHYLGYTQPVGEHLKYLLSSRRPTDRLFGLEFSALAHRAAGSIHRLDAGGSSAPPASDRVQYAFSDPAVGPDAASGQSHPRRRGSAHQPRLGAVLWASDLLSGDLCRHAAICRHLLSSGELAVAGPDHGEREEGQAACSDPVAQRRVGLSVGEGFSGKTALG